MDEKKAELFLKGLTIQLQDHLILSPDLSYNELTSATIDLEGMMKAYVEAREKKRIIHGSSGSGRSSSAPPKYHMVYTPPIRQPH
jgi:hypothetical protein